MRNFKITDLVDDAIGLCILVAIVYVTLSL
jgi:hypothetical protein